MNTRMFALSTTIVILSFLLSSCDQSPTALTEDRRVIPELRGIKLGSPLKEVSMIVFGESSVSSRVFHESATSYSVQVTSDSLIPSIGGSRDYRLTLDFLKRESPENSPLKSLTAIFPADSFEGVLQGLTEKYGKGRVRGKGDEKAYDWWLFDRQYRVGIFKGKISDEEVVFLTMTDMKLNNEAVSRNEELAAKKKAAASKDI